MLVEIGRGICSRDDVGKSAIVATHLVQRGDLEWYRDIRPRNSTYFVDGQHLTLHEITQILNDGAERVIVRDRTLWHSLPADRLLLATDSLEDIAGLKDLEAVLWTGESVRLHDVRTTMGKGLRRRGGTKLIYSREAASAASIPVLSTTTPEQILPAFLAQAITDRPDGLFPTVVSTRSGVTLGLVYSSRASILEILTTGRGVYQSRTRGLWRKGESSGSTQKVVSMRWDCDHDALQVLVDQHGTGFCHEGTSSCFGPEAGIQHLESTIHSRIKDAPEGSYTQRLLSDPELLAAKIREEADELCRATDAREVALEMADLVYFGMTRCIQAGVSWSDVESVLDERALKVVRRPGNAKPGFTNGTTRAVNGVSAVNGSQNAGDHVNRDFQKVATGPAHPSAPEKILTTGSATQLRMQRHTYSKLDARERQRLMIRPVLDSTQMIDRVRPLVAQVREEGDRALLALTEKFDGAKLKTPVMRRPFDKSLMIISSETRNAIDQAFSNIRRFHQAQRDADLPIRVETMPGVICERFGRPIRRVGLYVPGGTAILPSTAMMLGIPAMVAGCQSIVLATPPRKDGTVPPEVVYVADKVGAEAILLAGGAQAVAALAYGTESCPKVDKILGPGNQWVTAAKMLVQNDTSAQVSIDMPAGPSEELVIADATANPAFVAADLLSQAEHGKDSQVVLVTAGCSPEWIERVENEIHDQAMALDRVDILKLVVPQSLLIECVSLEEAVEFSNEYAPEHLTLNTEHARELMDKIENAGSVFVGPWSPESCGDYASGTNHTLPTYGYARQYSGVNTLSFMKHITSQELSREGLQRLGPTVMHLAHVEGLLGHKRAVQVRLEAA